MFLAFEIDKIHPGNYRVAVTANRGEITEPRFHPSIEDAIRETALDVPDEFGHFVEVRYAGMSSGTMLLREAPGLASETANRLVGLVAKMHEIGGI